MAHTCPECGCCCYCGGDIDDIDFGEDSEGADNCTHYRSDDCTGNQDHEDDYEVPESQPLPQSGR